MSIINMKSQSAIVDHEDPDFEPNFWFMTKTPLPVAIIISSYLYFIYKYGPKFMERRQPYSFRPFLILYNIVQVLACVYIIVTVQTHSEFSVTKIWKCSHYELNSTGEKVFNDLSFFTLWLKILELIETILFVLRKKQKQVTFLHVFHHCSTIILVYLLMKNLRGGAPMFPVYVNSFVHVIMYSYYLLAAIGNKKLQNTILPFKKFITLMQMLQFCFILLQVILQVLNNCPLHKTITSYYIFVVSVIFYLFYDFYTKNYENQNKLNNKIIVNDYSSEKRQD